MAVNTDDDLVSRARRDAGASDAAAIPDEAIKRELDGVKEMVRAEVAEALSNETMSLYDHDAPLKMAENLLKLRVADLRRQVEGSTHPGKGRGPPAKVPAHEVPRSFGRLRRHSFDDPTLKNWRDKAVRHRQRLTED